MTVDSSAIIAILHGEEDASRFANALVGADDSVISAPNWFETAIVIDSQGNERLSAMLDELRETLGLRIVSFTPEMADIARAAYRRFGRGHHPARLNFGDCFSYALAKSRGDALLFKGQDFSQTDIEPALI